MDQYTPPNILFYSKECPHCKKFAEILFKLPQVNDKFIKISVDDRRMRLPNFVQRVPTIVVFDKGQRNILTDTNVFGWINQFLEDASKVDLVPYDQGAMSSSLSDNFSFIGDENGKEAEHTFGWMDKLEDTRIGLVAENGNGPTTSSQNSKINDGQLERYLQERDSGIPQAQRPSQNIDFTKLYEQDSGSSGSSGVDQSAVVTQFQNFRQKQIRRGAPPHQGPDFQSQGFKAEWAGQSRRGGVVSNFGGQGNGNSKQKDLEDVVNRLQSQRDKDNNVFQQRQQGEYIPLSFNQQQQMMRQQGRSQQPQQPQPQQQPQQPQQQGRRPPPHMTRQRIV
jgi:thiol-disulfide isomerase/thioredoxin